MEHPDDAATSFHDLFRAVYLRFHRRDERRSELSAASRAVLTHLAMAGPLTVGEAVHHLDRAQSVVSDIVTQLESKGLLKRMADANDRRRTLVWLTPAGHELLRSEQDVLSTALLRQAFARMPSAAVETLVNSLQALLDADDRAGTRLTGPTHPKGIDHEHQDRL